MTVTSSESGPTLLGVLRAAVAFLTRVPVGKRVIARSNFAWAPSAFPLVGGAIGVLSAAALRCGAVFGSLAAACLAVFVGVSVTGAFHEDGLADTADALWGTTSRERALEIMKDSRIGSYGAVVLVLMIIARVALTAQTAAVAWIALPWAGCAARLGPVWLMTFLPHASPSTSKSKDLLASPLACPLIATLGTLAIGAGLAVREPAMTVRLALAVLLVGVASLWFARLGKRRLGGITGDLLGAAEQVGEVGVLLVFAWH